MHIVAATGFVGGDTALPFFERASVDYLTEQFVHEITVGIGGTGAQRRHHQGRREPRLPDDGARPAHLPRRRPRRARRPACRSSPTSRSTPSPRSTIFHEEGLPLDRVLFGHADDGVSQGKVRDTWIADQGGRIGFDTFGYDLELPDPPFWGRPRQERLDHFLRYRPGRARRQRARLGRRQLQPARLARASRATPSTTSSRCCIPDLREAGRRRGHHHPIFVDLPADFLSIQN